MQVACSIDEIIRQNSNLVYGICAKYNGYADKEDLHQVGMIGLIKAYNNYDESKEAKFSTYAFPYVVGEVSKYVRENKAIKVSEAMEWGGFVINGASFFRSFEQPFGGWKYSGIGNEGIMTTLKEMSRTKTVILKNVTK